MVCILSSDSTVLQERCCYSGLHYALCALVQYTYNLMKSWMLQILSKTFQGFPNKWFCKPIDCTVQLVPMILYYSEIGKYCFPLFWYWCEMWRGHMLWDSPQLKMVFWNYSFFAIQNQLSFFFYFNYSIQCITFFKIDCNICNQFLSLKKCIIK